MRKSREAFYHSITPGRICFALAERPPPLLALFDGRRATRTVMRASAHTPFSHASHRGPRPSPARALPRGLLPPRLFEDSCSLNRRLASHVQLPTFAHERTESTHTYLDLLPLAPTCRVATV
mmetsp:Transcript_780/g.2061  ORF Transcript_780/g.2061 Transcript_780/m.2061 type:complete len:122 (+) Transcript_780:1465-1830(+)